jgi:hypothetical protein
VVASLRVCIRWSLTTDVLCVTYLHSDSYSIFTFSYRSSSIVPRIFSRTNKGCCEHWLMGVVTGKLFMSSLEVNHRMRSLKIPTSWLCNCLNLRRTALQPSLPRIRPGWHKNHIRIQPKRRIAITFQPQIRPAQQG